MIIVSDTSPVSNLILIGRLALLSQLFPSLILPTGVYEELRELEPYGYPVSELLKSAGFYIRTPTHADQVTALMNSQKLDYGESEAIVLAMELSAETLLIDERKGYAVAEAMGLNPVGLLGVLIQAKSKGLIPELRPVLDELIYKAGFWVSKAVFRTALELAGEDFHE